MKMCDKNAMSQSDYVAATERGKGSVAGSHDWFWFHFWLVESSTSAIS